jgi:hypothetical protein
VAAYFLEVGVVLLVGPWSALWDRNAFAAWLPALAPLVRSAFVRGGVSGVGLVTMAAGLAELGSLISARRAAAARALSRTSPERS